jgi:hypothetical protein
VPLRIVDAQREMRFAYYGGAPGLLVSATAWFVAGMVALLQSPERAVWALFIGGMLIHPVATVVTRLLGRPARHSRDNPFGALAMATTFWLILCLFLAYGVSLLRIEWFFPAMLLVIGGRYLTFATIFGSRTYWACGTVLALAGCALASLGAAPAAGAFAGAAIEAAFAAMILVTAQRELRGPPAGVT